MNSSGKDSLLSLWAIPKKEEVPLILNSKLIIDNKLKGPAFPIHMTLVAQFQLNQTKFKVLEEEIANSFDPFEIEMEEPEDFDILFYWVENAHVKIQMMEVLIHLN